MTETTLTIMFDHLTVIEKQAHASAKQIIKNGSTYWTVKNVPICKRTAEKYFIIR